MELNISDQQRSFLREVSLLCKVSEHDLVVSAIDVYLSNVKNCFENCGN